MPRFYCPVPLAAGTQLSLPETVVRHIQVLRLAAGASITLFNGEGGAWQATLTGVERREAIARVDGFLDAEAELPYRLTLAQALPEASKMDGIVEKAVELGACAIEPLAAQRCVVRLSSEREERRRLHWQGIVTAAAEQCGRNRLLDIAPVADFKTWAARARPDACLVLSPRAADSLAAWVRSAPAQDVVLAIGPEGGFTPEEERLARANGATLVSMGPRVLRTETAGMAAIATINALWGGG